MGAYVAGSLCGDSRPRLSAERSSAGKYVRSETAMKLDHLASISLVLRCLGEAPGTTYT